jgi:PAS domain S-box-containing protein
MSLRLKTLLLGYSILIVFGLTIIVVAQSILLPGLAQIEANEMQKDLQRVNLMLQYQLNTMRVTASDWAEWDDTYAFMDNGNPAFLESNFPPETLSGLNFDAVVLVDTSGQIVYSQSIEPEGSDTLPILTGFETLLQPGSPLLVHTGPEISMAGIVQLPSSTAVVAVNDILTSLDEGPARGTFIWVRRLDAGTAEQIQTLYGLPATFYPLDDPTLPATPLEAGNTLNNTHTLVAPVDSNRLFGYLRLDDVFGVPAAILRLEKPRDLMTAGMALVRSLILVLLLIGVAVLIAMLAGLRYFILNRLFRLTSLVNRIQQTGNLIVDVPTDGKDEVSQLASGIAAMLVSLRQTQQNLEQARASLETRVLERTAELQQAKEDVEAILANTSDAIIQTDAQACIVRANPAFERLFEYDWHLFIGQPLDALALPEARPGLSAAIERVANGAMSERYELPMRRSNDGRFDAEMALSGVFDRPEQLRGMVAVFRDITERKAAETRQAELTAGLRLVLNLANALIDSEDVDTLCRRAIEGMREHLKLERCAIFLDHEGFLRGTYGTDSHGNLTNERELLITMNDHMWASRRQLLDPNAPRWLIVEEPHYEWDGEQSQVVGHGWVAITPILTSRGFVGLMLNDTAISHAAPDPMRQELVTVFCSLFGAILEHKRAEASVKSALDRQIELTALKARFVSMVSHEFRTPLAVIQTSVDILHRYHDRLTDERRVEYLLETERQVQHMKALMEDYLSLDRAEFGQIELSLTDCDIVTFCENVISDIRLISPQRQITLHTLYDSATIRADIGLLQQMLMNLLSNAIKYSAEDTEISITLTSQDNQVTLEIRDHGIGIPEDEQDKLFSTFFRASNARHRQGTGLGLAIVKRAVEAHQGRIAIQSEVGVGTVVKLTLPVSPAQMLKPAPV